MPRLSMALGLASVVLVSACSSAGSSTASTKAPASAAAPTKAPSSAAAPASAAASASAAAMQVMAKGELRSIDGTATGVVELVALPNGAYEVVLETFSIGSVAHTNVVLVSNASVTKTDDIDKTKLLDLGPLKGTSGMQTYVVPAAMAATVMGGYHSVVIWDTEMTHAIAAATLQ